MRDPIADLLGNGGFFSHVTNDNWREKEFERMKEGIGLIGAQKQAFRLVIICEELE